MPGKSKRSKLALTPEEVKELQQLAQSRGRVAGSGVGAKPGAAENTEGGGHGLGQEGFFICRGSEFPDRDAMVSFGDGKARRQ